MNRFSRRLALVLVLAGLVIFPGRAPAPLIYRPGEGWTYEMPGAKGDWHKQRAKEQLDFSQSAFDKKKYRLAQKSAKRIIQTWPLSDYAPQAQYLVARCYEARKMDEKAFDAYQTMLDKYPKNAKADEAQTRQFAIAVRYLHGQWFKLWGYIPFFPSMDKTAGMFQKIVKYGPYGPLGPESQMNVGAAREKEKDYPLAVKAYEEAADRYNAQPKIAADALYKQAMAYNKQARRADYDQSVAGQAITTFTDFIALYPDDPRTATARHTIDLLRSEEARGNYNIAKYYEEHHRWDGALIYYNEVLLADAGSPLALQARQHIQSLRNKAPGALLSPEPTNAPAAPEAKPDATPAPK